MQVSTEIILKHEATYGGAESDRVKILFGFFT
jgi:hypothetical protein